MRTPGPRPRLVALLAMPLATLLAVAVSASDRPPVLEPGVVMPSLEGDFLSGKPAVLPDAARGKVALVALGFTYDSRFAVEAWGSWFKAQVGGRPDVTYFEVPMMGRAARLGRFFIDRGMRKGTPKDAHDHVITVYGDTGPWKARVGFTEARENDAYLLLIGRDGTIAWKYTGPFDEAQAAALEATVENLLAGR
jgi:hypothetical protein